MERNLKWTVDRITDTLNKYSNHKILSISQIDNIIAMQIEYISEKFNSRVSTIINIYADGEKE